MGVGDGWEKPPSVPENPEQDSQDDAQDNGGCEREIERQITAAKQEIAREAADAGQPTGERQQQSHPDGDYADDDEQAAELIQLRHRASLPT